jgi:hypothetical protein
VTRFPSCPFSPAEGNVSDPVRAVGEFHRVLRPEGIVYSETPFLQPVKGGAYDFTRYSVGFNTANRRIVEDPHWIYPRQVLRIPGVPALRGPDAARADAGVDGRPGDLAAELALEHRRAEELLRTRFYYGSGPGTMQRDPRLEGFEDEEHRGVQAWEFHAAPWLQDPGALPIVARLKAIADLEPRSGARLQGVRPYQRVFITQDRRGRALVVGEELLVVRTGRSMRPHGRVIEPAAILRVQRLEADGDS